MVVFSTASGEYCVQAVHEKIKWLNYSGLKSCEKLTEIFSSQSHTILLTDDNIAVIVIPTFMNDALGDEFYKNMPKIRDCRGYIIDIRNNGGGNSDNADFVVQAFIDGEFTFSTDKKMVHIGSYKACGQNQNLDTIDQSDEWLKKVYDISKRQYFEYSSDRCSATYQSRTYHR